MTMLMPGAELSLKLPFFALAHVGLRQKRIHSCGVVQTLVDVFQLTEKAFCRDFVQESCKESSEIMSIALEKRY